MDNKKNEYNYNDKIKKEDKFYYVNWQNNDLDAEIGENNNDIQENTYDNESLIKNKKYLDFNHRIIINSILLLISLSLALYFSISSFSIKKNQTVNYKEKGNIEYHVFLNKNEFYEESYLPQNMLYVSSIIDKINVNFNYEFQIEENINTEFSYKVIGELSIMDNSAKNSFYQKEFTLLENQVVQMKNEKSKKITENITVDFMRYNNIANDFKKKFSVTTSSNFVVKLIITKNSLDKNITFNGDKNLNLIIPLSQREIRLTTDSINEENNIVKKTYVEMTNYFNLVIAIIFIIITIILTTTLYKKIKLILPHKSVYDKFVSDILNEYDRYIINTKVKPNLAKNITVTKLDDFQELLDARYNTKLPIKFYNITEHQKCMFYILTDNEIYEYIIKAVDLDKEN